MKPNEYFDNVKNAAVSRKYYEAMRAYFVEKMSASKIAEKLGYTVQTVYSMIKKFRMDLKNHL